MMFILQKFNPTMTSEEDVAIEEMGGGDHNQGANVKQKAGVKKSGGKSKTNSSKAASNSTTAKIKFKCEFCTKSYSDENQLHTHTVMKHAAVPEKPTFSPIKPVSDTKTTGTKTTFSCKFCTKSYKDENQLHTHSVMKHSHLLK